MIRTPSPRRQLEADTRVLLSSLGDDPVQIAATLDAFGVRATPGDPWGCAIAVFLHALLSGERGVASISVTNTEVRLNPPTPWRRSAHVLLSDPLRQFVSSFDVEGFPALVRGETRRSPGIPNGGPCERPERADIESCLQLPSSSGL